VWKSKEKFKMSAKPAVIDLTADDEDAALDDEEEEEEELLLYTSRVLIKGLQHYRGVAHPGEYVNLVREPNNLYDRNAIRVLNLDQMQVGHIQKEVAAVLAPLMDDRRGLATIEATIPRPSGTWTQDVDLEIYTTAADRAAVNEILLRRREHAFRLVPGPGAIPSPAPAAAAAAAAPAAAQIVVSKKNMSAKPKSQHSVEQLMDQLQAKQWPEFNLATLGAASGLILSKLYPHQLQGLSFLVQRESDEGLPPFWTEANERGARVFFNSITSSSRAQRPAPVRGGVLADDMGLGKSIQLLSLIVARPPPGVVYTVGAHRAATEQAQQKCDDEGWEWMSASDLQKICKERKINGAGSKAELVDKLRLLASAGPAVANVNKTTLIVCPLSVMQGWADQIEAHIAPHSLRYYLYSGAGRVADDAFLRSFDIVLVSYSTLAAELSNGPPVAAGNKRGRDAGGVLGSMEFHRVILDEAHSIRNRQTKVFQACLALKSKYRWALSGTPIQNKSEDAYPLFAFLKAEPCSAWDVFNRAVARPIKEGDVDGITRLRAFFSGVTLRRNKEVIRQLLPPKAINLTTLRMTDKQREAYTLVFASAQAAVRAAMEAEGDQGNIMTSILECIMRLRQACDDVSIVPPERLQRAAQLLARLERGELAGAAAAAAGGAKKKLTVEDARLLFAALQGALAEEDASCCICFEELSEDKTRLLRACRHSLCDTCAEAMLQKPPCTCPLCRAPFGRNDVIEPASIREAAGPADGENDDEGGAVGENVKPAAAAAAEAAAAPVPAEVSPKVAALLEAIAAMRAEAGGEQLKAVVFSQFVSYLDVIQHQLRAAGVSFSRLDGSMTQKRRSAQLAKWRIPNAESGTTVLIVSTRAGGQGLNLTEGSRVFLLDPLWSAAAEEQAMDRVHRLGQRKRVVVTRYVMENSIEEKILKLQANKAALNKGALTKLSPAELAAARRAEIKSLFEL